MGVNAGMIATAGKMPGERIATRILTADSDAFSAESEVMNVVAQVIAGRTYRVWFWGHLNSSVATDDFTARIRETDVNGTELSSDRVAIDGSATSGRKCYMEVEWDATATGFQAFVITIVRSAGTGNGFVEAAGGRPAYLAVDYIRDK